MSRTHHCPVCQANARDLEMLAKLRSEPCFARLLSELEGIQDVADCAAGELLLQLLKGGA